MRYLTNCVAEVGCLFTSPTCAEREQKKFHSMFEVTLVVVTGNEDWVVDSSR